MACVLPSLFPKFFPWTSCQKAYKMCFSTLEPWGIQIRQVLTLSLSLLEFSFALLTSCLLWLPLYCLVLHFCLNLTFNVKNWDFHLKGEVVGWGQNADKFNSKKYHKWSLFPRYNIMLGKSDMDHRPHRCVTCLVPIISASHLEIHCQKTFSDMWHS